MSRREVSWAPKPEVLRAIPVGAIHEFLTRRGWVQQPTSRSGFRYYEHREMRTDEGKPLHYIFPASDDTDDYPLSVLYFIEGQARLWDLDPHAVLDELKRPTATEPARTSMPA